MAVDLETLIAPVAGDDPVGPDLSYDPEREEIERAFASSVSAEGEGGDQNWRETIALIEAQSARTKDLWLAAYLARAGARGGDFDRVVLGARYMAGLLESYWDGLHPRLDEYGLQGRKTPCESLASIGEFLRYLEQVPLVRHPRFGMFSGRDFVRFADHGADEDGYGLFRAALEDMTARIAAGEDGAVDPIAAAIDGLDAIRDAVRRSDAVLVANAGDGESGANFERTYEVIEVLRRAVSSFGATPDADTAVSGDPGDAATALGTSGGGKAGGRVDSRDDVLRSLDAIVEYYRRREPGSPMPVLLGRARDWVNADFLTIMEDIAPSGMDDVRRVLTSQRSTEY